MIFRYLILSAALLTLPAQLDGQTDSTCSYDACSLHVQQRFMSTWIMRGMASHKALKLGFTGAGVDTLVASSDSAVIHAHRFQRHHTASNVLGMLSAAAGLTAWLLSSDHDDLALGATIAGIGFGFAASQTRKSAGNALARSVWWYNRTLQHPRGDTIPPR